MQTRLKLLQLVRLKICRPESALQLIIQHTQHSLALHWCQNSSVSSPRSTKHDTTAMLAERLETPCSPPTASANTAGPANHQRFPEMEGTTFPLSDKKLLFLATCGCLWESFRNISVCPSFPRANITALAPSLHQVRSEALI